MRLSGHSKIDRLLGFSAVLGIVVIVGYLGANSRAQEKAQSPARTSYVNDFAGVVDEKTKQRLEVVLENVKLRSGIEFDLATVQTTGTQDIFDFSRQLASDWDVGARNSAKKTLLLVVSVNEKAVFTQFSKSVQAELPEGILGELSQRVRGPISSGQFSQGLSDGIDHFVAAMAKKLGFSLQDIDQVQTVVAEANPATVVPTPTAPTGTVTGEANAVATPSATTPETREPASSASRPRRVATNSTTPANDENESEEVELTLTLPLAERIVKLKEFQQAHPNSKSKQRAAELLISSYAGLGDQQLKDGESKGVEQLMLAVNEAPANMSERLFAGVIAQIPLNLYLRGFRDAALDAARLVEAKFGADPKRLVTIAGFYLGIEDGEEASRIADQAIKLAPESADAHYVLGRGLHISLKLDEAAAEYKRALELDPTSKKAARRALADLNRGMGKAEEALALYREQLTAEPGDKAARAGLVLSLLDLGRSDEGNKELANSLQDDPRNLALLTGAAYWFAAHNDAGRALELAQKAVALEPRYTWSQIALARALLGQKKPLEAEGPIRIARQYGRFPTLDYELASVLAAAGLYEEAAEVLLQSFNVKDGQVETRLAGRLAARESDFTKLLAPERRASIFQFAMADDATSAATLKALLAFTLATQAKEGERPDEAGAAATAKEFAAGADDMRAYRQLYAAGLLLKNRIALQTAYDLADAAKPNVEAALTVPAVTVAVQAEEYRELRAQAIAQGSTPNIAEAPRGVLANILRGRAEDITGWALYNQEKTAEAIDHLRRAVSIFPEGVPAWRTSLWHLGAALDQAGDKQEALSYYIKSYTAGDPDAARRTVIEQLYQKINGSLDGLDERIGPKLVAANVSPGSSVSTPAAEETPSPASPQPRTVTSPELTATPAPTVSPAAVETAPPATPAATPEATPTSEPTPSPTPVAPTSSPEATPPPTPSPSPVETFPGTLMRTTVKISGRVSDASNTAVPNAVVVLISPKGTVLATTTDSEGNYSFIVSLSQQSYRVIPSKDGYIFQPVDKVLTSMSDDQKEVDFVATPRAP